ncbi:MAG: 2-hydroxychromene-2-carboxylate isomerase [Myxococcota bacterium]
MEIEFVFDVVCPFAYLASTRVGALGVQVRWSPVLLGGLFRAHGAPSDPNAVMPAAKQRWTRTDLARQAAVLGVPVRFPDAHPRRTVDAMRLLVGAPEGLLPALAARLYRAYWVDGDDVADRAVLRAIGLEFGLDADVIVDDPAVKAALRARTDAAAARGVFGVPSTIVGDEVFWGADRLRFVRRALGLPDAPAPGVPAAPSRPPATIEWFHDVASPFSYLASTRVAKLAADTGATLIRRPILLGALFRDVGTPEVPLFTFSTAKQAYVHADLRRWAAWWDVPIRWPSTFPIRSLIAQRVAVAEPAATDALYRAAWVDDRDVSTADGVRAVLDGAGFDGAALVARTSDPAIKDRLRADTERGRDLGVVGVPTFVVDGALFWGQDRLDHVDLAARGYGFDPVSVR